MANDEPRRRYLIAVGITAGLSKSGPRIVDSVNRMAQTLTKDFGYERVTALDIDPPAEQVRKEIREFCLKCGPDDVVVLYYTGHADEVNEKHRVWAGDTVDPISGTLETGHLAELMLTRTPLRNSLIILDTCFAGKGGAEALRASVSAMDEGAGKTLALLTAAYPREQIVAGDFARLFVRALEQRSVAGHEPPYLTLGAIASVIEADPSRPGWQTVSQSVLFGTTDQMPFFPNQRYNPQLHGLDLLTQLRIEQRELRLADLRGHFLPRARGVDVPTEPGWRFVGRSAALRDLVSWLRDTGDLRARIVTGGPGSGKSAVIGRLVVLSDRDWRRLVPVEDLAPATIPPEGSLATGIHARGMTTAQVLGALCAEAGARADTPADLLREIRGRKLTVAIDAIDEALDPPGLVSSVLRPLIEAGPAEGLRLLLGTRPHLVESLGVAQPAVDLDDERYADPESIYQYVLRGLESAEHASPYHCAPADLVAGVARAVAEAAGYSFLVALIVSRTLLSQARVPDPADRAWRESLPETAADAMHHDLQTRLGPDADRARDLLRPLAFAAGAGLPWENLWASLATQLSGRSYTDDDLVWLRQQAGSYVLEAMEAGRSAYRLYHAALAEYLRHGFDEEIVHGSFCVFLLSRVPAARTGLDWARAHPYTLAHLATHAQRAGLLDSLLRDPGYLVNAVPVGLLAALPAASQPDAELAAAAYQRVVHQLRGRPADERLSYLEFGARIARATELASRIANRAPHRPWSILWTHWPREYPHRILGGHLGELNAVLAEVSAGKPVVISIGADAKLRIWDLATSEPGGAYPVGTAPLIAARVVRFADHRVVIVILGADGMLHFWDMATATLLRTVPVTSSWRRLASLENADLTLGCLAVPGGRHFAVTSGRAIPTSVWEIPSGRLIAVLSWQASREDIGYTSLSNGRIVLVAKMGNAVRWMHDILQGQDLPSERHRAKNVSYYTTSDGEAVIAVRFRRRTAVVWDLAANRTLGTWRRDLVTTDVRLVDGRVVAIPLDPGIGSMAAPAVGDAIGSRLMVLPPGETASSAGRRDLRAQRVGRFLQVEFLYSDENPAVSLTLAGHTADVTGYDWLGLPDGRVVVVTASRDGTIRRWDINSIRQEPGADAAHAGGARRIVAAGLEGGASVGLTSDSTGEITLWDLRSGTYAGRLSEPSAMLGAVDVAHPPGRTPMAVTAGTDGTMRTWSLPDGRQTGMFPADRYRWPSAVSCLSLPDGTMVAVTSGHGRKVVVWELSTGRMRDVFAAHRAWSSCVAHCDEPGFSSLVLSGGLDNRVNAWDLGRGHPGRHRRFRIVAPWTFLAHPSAGRAYGISMMPLRGGGILVLVSTEDGMARLLKAGPSMRSVRRTGAVEADVASSATLSNGLGVIVTAADGVVRVWDAAAFALGSGRISPLCEISIEVPVEDLCAINGDVAVLATPNGLIAIRFGAQALANHANSNDHVS